MKKAISARSKSRKDKRINSRIPIMAEIVKESVKEDIINYFSAHPEINSIGEKPSRLSPYQAEISLTDDLKLWANVFIRYSYYPKNEKVVNDCVDTLSAGDIIEYILDYEFVQSIISEETKYYLNTLYDLCEHYIENYLSKKEYTVGEIMDHFSLSFARDVTCLGCRSIEEVRKTRLPKEFCVSRVGSDRVDGGFRYITELDINYKLIGTDESGQRTRSSANMDVHLSDLIDKVLQKDQK